MIELTPIELVIFGVLCFVAGNIIPRVVVWTWKLAIGWGNGNTSLVRPNIKSELDSTLGKKDWA